MPTEHGTRRAALRALLARARRRRAAGNAPDQHRYLSGFHRFQRGAAGGEAGEDGGGWPAPAFCTDGRYTTQVGEEVPDPSSGDRAGLRVVPAGAPRQRRRRVGFESHVVTVDAFARAQAAGDTELVRRRGTGGVAAGGQGCRRDRAAAAGLRGGRRGADGPCRAPAGLRPGRTEKEVGRELESLMLDHGADGSRSRPSSRRAQLGDPAPPAHRRGPGGR